MTVHSWVDLVAPSVGLLVLGLCLTGARYVWNREPPGANRWVLAAVVAITYPVGFFLVLWLRSPIWSARSAAEATKS